jgi:mannose-6-phosphate isomerase-like protein (cupin superfamily)
MEVADRPAALMREHRSSLTLRRGTHVRVTADPSQARLPSSPGDTMQHRYFVGIALAFTAGLFMSPVAQHAVSEARAQPAGLTPMMIDLAAIKHGELPGTPNPEMNARALVVTENATIGIQSGNVAKHVHPKTDEIQYIIEGSGAMWLGGERKEFKPGTLIIIPKGTAHAGTVVTNGPVKAIAIKIPPQPRDDVVFVD